MPKVVSYDVPWLSRPSPGYGIFSGNVPNASSASPKRSALMSPRGIAEEAPCRGPKKLVASRGTEVFAVVGKQIRWADLASVKSAWDQQPHGRTVHSSIESIQEAHRILNVSIHQEIRQIIASPSGHFLALLTSHTVHIAILPDRSHLQEHDTSPLKLRTWQVGRTAHCLGDGRSPVVTALWHPLALSSNHQDCLVTITADAVVRLWEFERHSTYTMDHPTLAVDLKKLADGQSCDDDFAPSGLGKVQAFSPDLFEMEVASARFGGQGYEDEEGWAPMTLWLAMRNGDVYALCPLLPTRWTPSKFLIPSLSGSVVAKMALLQSGEIDPEHAKAIRQQYQWVREIDDENPALGTPDSEDTPAYVIRKRPANPSPIPRLQGPYIPNLTEDELEELDVTDIHVVSAKIRPENELEEDEDEESPQGASTITVCLATVEGKVLVCLNLDGVEGQWLPKTKKAAFSVPNTEASELLVLDTIDPPSTSQVENQWPTFTDDLVSPYSFFLTTASTVQYYSLAEWMPRLQSEMNSSIPTEGNGDALAFRMKILCESDITLHEEVLQLESTDAATTSSHLSSSLVFESLDIGYLLLTTNSSHPHTVLFDDPSTESAVDAGFLALPAPTDAPMPESLPIRPAYTPASAFYNPPASTLLHTLTAQVPSRHRALLKSEVRMSPATLDMMANSHRTISSQTSALERSAAELFRRVERLRSEIRDAVDQMVTLADRLQGLQEDIEGNEKGSIEERFSAVDARQNELVTRYLALKQKVAQVGHPRGRDKDLSTKEIAWVEEIHKIGKNVGVQVEGSKESAESQEDETATLGARYERIQNLSKSLLSQISSLPPPPPSSSSRPQTPSLTSAANTNPNATDPSLPLTKPNDTPTEKSLKESLLSSSQNQHRPSSSSSHHTNGNGGTPSSIPAFSNMPVSSKMQRRKIEEAMQLVEREGAVIEATMRRLRGLGLE